MVKMRLLIVCLFGVIMLTSCKNQNQHIEIPIESKQMYNETLPESNTIKPEQPYTETLSESNTIESEQAYSETISHIIEEEYFDYGDELSFYLEDEKRSEYPSAISIVQSCLEAQIINDYDTWLSLLTPEKQQGFSKETNGDFGIISFEIIDIHYETDIKYKQNILKCKKAVDMGLTADNIAKIYVHYVATYDHTKVPSDDGERKWHYTLIRDNNNSPWYIQSWGYGYGGI